MKFIRSFLLLSAGIFLLAGCTVYNKVHFNRDYSGTFEMIVDLESMLMMASAFDTTNTMDEDELINELQSEMNKDEMAAELNAMPGVSNGDLTIDKERGLVLTFDFEDITSLNNSFSEIQSSMDNMGGPMGEVEGAEKPKFDAFVLNGKTLTYRSPPKDPEGENELDLLGEEGGEDMMSEIGDFFEMKFEFSFDRKVKSVDAAGMTIVAQEKHRVLADVNMQEVVKDGAFEINIRLK
jgi:hypothetical protein